MNLSEFRALIAEYALEHPERPLSDVSMVEFLLWRDIRKGCVTPEQIMGAPFTSATGTGCAHHARDVGEPCDVCGKVKDKPVAPEDPLWALYMRDPADDPEYGPPYFNADGTNTPAGIARVAARDRHRASARAIRDALDEVPGPDLAAGSPRCGLCKDTGWRRSVDSQRKVPCECGARGVIDAVERSEHIGPLIRSPK